MKRLRILYLVQIIQLTIQFLKNCKSGMMQQEKLNFMWTVQQPECHPAFFHLVYKFPYHQSLKCFFYIVLRWVISLKFLYSWVIFILVKSVFKGFIYIFKSPNNKKPHNEPKDRITQCKKSWLLRCYVFFILWVAINGSTYM